MPGIPREFAEHSLETYPGVKPVKQTTRRLSEPKRLAVGAEIDRPLKANFIREIKISTWLANPVLVPKKNTDILRMCIDYTSLNSTARRTISRCLESIKLSTRQQDANVSLSSTPNRVINKSE